MKRIHFYVSIKNDYLNCGQFHKLSRVYHQNKDCVGIVHLGRSQIIPKTEHFLHPDTHRE